MYGTFITGDHCKQDHILFVKIGTCIVFCVYRRSYLLWSPVIDINRKTKRCLSIYAQRSSFSMEEPRTSESFWTKCVPPPTAAHVSRIVRWYYLLGETNPGTITGDHS